MFESSPLWIALTALFFIGLLRGQATYWLARVLTEQGLNRTHPAGGWRARAHDWLQGDGLARGRATLQRWGLIVVPLCYLTWGLQTLVLAAAGVLRIRWILFTLAQIPGAAAWAVIYSTLGFAVWHTSISAVQGSPQAIATLVLIVVVAAAGIVLIRRRRSAHTPLEGEEEGTVASEATPR